MPGNVINALRSVFDWQKKPLANQNEEPKPLDGFTLMFTTQIGPPGLPETYLGMLRETLTDNLAADEQLQSLLVARAGHGDVAEIQTANFDLFFKLAMPKVLARTLMDADWYVDPDMGFKIFAFDRQWKGGSYTMLHMVANVRRKIPPQDKRAPGAPSPVAEDAYRKVVRRVFSEAEAVVTDAAIDEASLKASLELIASRRKKYYPDV